LTNKNTDVLNQIVGDSAQVGNSLIKQIKIVPDYPNGVMMDTACDDGSTYAAFRELSSTAPSTAQSGPASQTSTATALGPACLGG
jgi:hypothetical protein